MAAYRDEAGELARWAEGIEQVYRCVAGRFRRSEPRRRALDYLRGLLSPVERKNALAMAEAKAEMLRGQFKVDPAILHLRRGRGGCVFFVVPQPGKNGEIIEERVERFLDTDWNRHFERIPSKALGREV